MVQTRHLARKIKFDDDGEGGDDIIETSEVINVNSESDKPTEDPSDSESDSDEAPEEEATGKAKQELLRKEAKKREVEAEKKRQERERRKQQNLYNQQQQQEKKLKQLEREQQQKQQQPELPDLLPEDILSSINESDMGSKDFESKSTSKHIRLDDPELTNELKKQLKIEKLKQLKAANKSSVKKGPVHVKVLSNSKLGKVPPKADKIINSRDKWLKRKSLNKK